MPVRRLLDERILDAILGRLKEVDDAAERRRKLDTRPAGTGSAAGPTSHAEHKPAGQWAPQKKKADKGQGKGKGGKDNLPAGGPGT